MATTVLDSWALIALFNEEPASEEVEKLLHAATAGRHTLLMAWSTGAKFITRRGGDSAAKSIASNIAQMPITLVPVDAANLALARQAAIFKATKKMSYADCFGAALAKLQKVDFVTGDAEFRAEEGEVKIAWLSAKVNRSATTMPARPNLILD